MSFTITILHPSKETLKYSERVYKTDNWRATQYSCSRKLDDNGGGVDTLTPKYKGTRSLQKTAVAYLLSFNFEITSKPYQDIIFRPPEDTTTQLQHAVTFPRIVQHLGAVFKDPLAILRFLAKEGGFLGGSEALQVFVSGATDENSDMDFYIDRASVVEMMLLLAKSGVFWLESAADEVDEALKSGYCYISNQLLRYIALNEEKGEHSILQRNLYHFFKAARSQGMIDEQAELAAAKYVATDGTTHYIIESCILQISERKIEIEEAIKGTKTPSHVGKDETCADRLPSPLSETSEDDSTNMGYGGGMLVVNGTIQTQNGTIKRVQLITNRYYGNKSSVFEILMRFWGSHIQCFIGGWCAGHTLYRSAKSRKMHLWRLQAQNPQSVGKAMKKYRQRGFVDAQESHPHWRNLFDEHSYFIDFSHEVLKVQANQNWWLNELYFRRLYNMTVNEIIDRESEAEASDNDELWLTNRRANLVSIQWQNVRGCTHYPRSTLFAEGLFRWAW